MRKQPKRRTRDIHAGRAREAWRKFLGPLSNGYRIMRWMMPRVGRA